MWLVGLNANTSRVNLVSLSVESGLLASAFDLPFEPEGFVGVGQTMAVDPRSGASRGPSAASGTAPVSASAAAAALQQRSKTRSPTRRDGSPTARISKVWSTHMPHEESAQASSIK